MVRYFCDGCGREIPKGEGDRLTHRVGRVSVEVMTAVNNTWNAGCVCHDCVRKFVADSAKPAKKGKKR